jgi:hypothetical protein
MSVADLISYHSDRMSAGYILSSEKGNTKGLGGNEGLLEAIGCPLPFWETRSYLGNQIL